MTAAITDNLTGTKRVELTERDGSPWRVTVRVYRSEVPDQAALEAAIASQKPVGIVLTLDIQPGASYDHMRTVHGPTYADLAAAFPTYASAANHVPST